MALRIGIDAHAIGERRTGNERFIANLIPALRELSPHELFLYFTNPKAAEDWSELPGTSVRVLRPAHPLVRIPLSLPWRALRDRLHVLLVQYTGPPLLTCPLVTVVHDVAFARFPDYYSKAERLWMPRTIPFTMRRASRVVTVSHFSQREITDVYGIPPEKISVAYNAVHAGFAEPSAGSSPVEPPFFLTVGNLQPRKNLVTLVSAFRRLVEAHPDLRERLVIVGQEWHRAAELYRMASDLTRSGRIVFTGYLADEEMAALIRQATAFAYPSIYEGFGLPPLEAMAAGAPALVSDIPVTRELFDGSAFFLPPTDDRAWAEALLRTARDPSLRASLIERGLALASRFTPEASARPVLTALEEAAAAKR